MKRIILYSLLILSINKASAQCWKSVADGFYFSLALKNDSTLWQSGFFFGFTSGIPIQITSPQKWKLIAGGAFHAIAQRSDNTLWGWGANWEGELGDGTYQYRDFPVQIGNDTD